MACPNDALDKMRCPAVRRQDRRWTSAPRRQKSPSNVVLERAPLKHSTQKKGHHLRRKALSVHPHARLSMSRPPRVWKRAFAPSRKKSVPHQGLSGPRKQFPAIAGSAIQVIATISFLACWRKWFQTRGRHPDDTPALRDRQGRHCHRWQPIVVLNQCVTSANVFGHPEIVPSGSARCRSTTRHIVGMTTSKGSVHNQHSPGSGRLGGPCA